MEHENSAFELLDIANSRSDIEIDGFKKLRCGKKIYEDTFSESSYDEPIVFKTPGFFKNGYPKKVK